MTSEWSRKDFTETERFAHKMFLKRFHYEISSQWKLSTLNAGSLLVLKLLNLSSGVSFGFLLRNGRVECILCS